MAKKRARRRRVRLKDDTNPSKQRQTVQPNESAEPVDIADPSPVAGLGHNNPPGSSNDPLVFLTPFKAAKVLDMSTVTLATWRIEGKGPPFYQLGRSVRYALAELIDWTRTRRRTSTSDATFTRPDR